MSNMSSQIGLSVNPAVFGPQPLRKFNAAGIARFRQFLSDLRNNPTIQPPVELLSDSAFAELVPGTISVIRPATGIASKRQAAELLNEILAPLCAGGRDVSQDAGLWAWLTLFFFDDVCPQATNGRRKPLAEPHYIPDVANSKRWYRHLLLTAYTVLLEIPKYNRLILDRQLSSHGEIVEQWFGRLFLRRVPSVAEAAEILYYDPASSTKHKRGAMPKDPKPGDFRNRFYVRVRQLVRTHDIFVLDGHQLVDHLGSEFSSWKTSGPAT